MIRSLLLSFVALAVAGLVVQSLPDVVRYLEMREM
jgi:hypothetical protein